MEGFEFENYCRHQKRMTAFCVTLAIGIAFICTAANAAPAQMQSNQIAANQKFDWRGMVPVVVDVLSKYVTDTIANGQNRDAEVAAINAVSSQDAKAADFWREVGPQLVSVVGKYLANKIANGENQETDEAEAQFWGTVVRFAAPYILNRVFRPENQETEEAKAQFWSTALSIAAPYILDKVFNGDEMAMSEVAKTLPEEARAEGWRRVGGRILTRQLG